MGVFGFLCAGSQSRTGHACLFRSELDYIITPPWRGAGRFPRQIAGVLLLKDSLYTFLAHARLGSGLSRLRAPSPSSPSYSIYIAVKSPEDFRAALYR